MYETSKAVQRRLHDPNFITRYLRGNGIDIGSGNDPLGQYVELFPLMESCQPWDKEDGNAEEMILIDDARFDFVHASHVLEDTRNPARALESWFRILKPGGHLIVLVPDEDMYEQGQFPSTFNADHKWTFTIHKRHSWGKFSVNVIDLIEGLGDAAEIVKIEQLTSTYRYSLPRQDQTRTPIGEAAIEFVVRKRRQTEIDAGMSRPLVDIKHTIAGRSQKPKIALHRPGAIGDIIMTLALVPLLKQKYPEHEIEYFCHPSIGTQLGRLMIAAGVNRGVDCAKLEERKDQFDHVFNLIGYPLHQGYPFKPMTKHLIEYFADEVGLDKYSPAVDFVLELPHLTAALPPRLPDMPERYATIHPIAGWSVYKNWPLDRWQQVIDARPDIKFYQIGGDKDQPLLNVNTRFMGKPLDESMVLMTRADLHVGIDSWTNHLTNVEWKGRGFTPAVILWGSTQWDAAGYPRNDNLSRGLPCQPCFREDPKISRMPIGPCITPPGQVYEKPMHACMHEITVENVLQHIEARWPK
jgi:ADP-heptose:LPS heptosyltransferase/SAM-dependent methyltransferase